MLTRDELKAYFQAHLNDVVGTCGDGSCCPLAQALKAKFRVTKAQAEPDYMSWYDANNAPHRVPTERWQDDFMKRIDNYDRPIGVAFETVTGAKALAILEEVPHDAE